MTGFLFVILFPALIQAKTMYVSDSIGVTLRTGPGIDHKIIHMIKSGKGQGLEVLEEGEKWTMVRMNNGKEGWVMNRYLTEDTPNVVLLERLQRKYDNLLEKYEKLKEDSSSMKTENAKLNSELNEKSQQLSETSNSYESLKSESADFFELKSKYQKAKTELDEQTKKADELEDKLTEKNITWFLSGSGVLLVGLILGLSTKRQKRNSLLS